MCLGDVPFHSVVQHLLRVSSDASVFNALALQEGRRAQGEGGNCQTSLNGQPDDGGGGGGVRFIDRLLRTDPNERQTAQQILNDDFLRPATKDSTGLGLTESVRLVDRCWASTSANGLYV